MPRACTIKGILEKEEHPLRSFTTLPLLTASCITAFSAIILTCSKSCRQTRQQAAAFHCRGHDRGCQRFDQSLHVFNVAGSGKASTSFGPWYISRRLSAVPSPDSVCRLFFGIQDTGVHFVTVTGLGQGNTESEPETTKVLVLLDPPVVHFLTRGHGDIRQ